MKIMAPLLAAAFCFAALTNTGCSNQTPANDIPAVQAAAAPQAGSAQFWISPKLELGGKSIHAALQAPFDAPYPVTLKSAGHPARTIGSCQDYLPLEKTIYSAGPAADAEALRSEGARCDALDLLQSLQSCRPAQKKDFSLAQIKATQLPPELALAISDQEQAKARAVAKRGGSIVDFDKTVTLKVINADEMRLGTKNWDAKIQVYAHGSALCQGGEHLLLRSDISVTGGTYRASNIYLLSRTSGASFWRVDQERP